MNHHHHPTHSPRSPLRSSARMLPEVEVAALSDRNLWKSPRTTPTAPAGADDTHLPSKAVVK